MKAKKIFLRWLLPAALAAGVPLICAMGPGDFTGNGHFIVVTGYDGEGFSIRDPNSPSAAPGPGASRSSAAGS